MMIRGRGPRLSGGGRLALRTVLLFVVLYGVYLFLNGKEITVFGGVPLPPLLYTVAAAALFIAYYFVNRGLTMEKTPADQLPEEWTLSRKTEYLKEEAARRAKAKVLLSFLMPFVFVLLVDLCDLLLFDGFLTELAAKLLG